MQVQDAKRQYSFEVVEMLSESMHLRVSKLNWGGRGGGMPTDPLSKCAYTRT